MMKKAICTILLGLVLLPGVGIVRAAALPTMDVVVTNSGGKTVYKGTTSGNGSFSTGDLAPGNYVVQFSSKNAGKGKFALQVTAGKNQMSADALGAERFSDPGVAMKVKVEGKTKLSGQVAQAGALPKQAQPAAGTTANAKNAAQGPVKVINGKRYIWVRPNSSEMAGGEWVEEEKAAQMQQGGKVVPGTQKQSQGGMRGY